MKHRTLWSAVDVDRSKWWQWGAYVALCLAVLIFVFWMMTQDGFRAGNFRGVGRLIAALVPVIVFPFTRIRAARSAIRNLGGVPAPAGTLRDTRRALADFSIARGQAVPDLYLFYSASLNAIAYKDKGKDRIAVSSAFSALPVGEQRAGVAMLLGRDMLNVESIVMASKFGIPTRKDGNPAKPSDLSDKQIATKVVSSWLEAATAGDRQGLMLTKEPVQMLQLLKRLAMSETFLPLKSIEAAYGCLAWPFGNATGDRGMSEMPLKAREALAAMLAPDSSAGFPEFSRLSRLQEVLPAGERQVPDPPPIHASAEVRDARFTARAPASAAGGAAAVDAPRTVVGSNGVVATLPKAAQQAGPRIALRCPKCGANNVATNHACISCGKPLSAPAR